MGGFPEERQDLFGAVMLLDGSEDNANVGFEAKFKVDLDYKLLIVKVSASLSRKHATESIQALMHCFSICITIWLACSVDPSVCG
jgi:hypothetical protein